MQPYRHAIASAGRAGGDWRADLPIHEFMDLAKHACPDLRHRLVLHNSDFGPELSALAFGARADAREVALDHVRQDLGWTPPLSAWLATCDPFRLPPELRERECDESIVDRAADHLGLATVEPVQRVWDLLQLPLRLAPQSPLMARALLMSSVGPILARAVLGPPTAYERRSGGETIIDFSWICEGMIVAQFGSIISLERVLACMTESEPQRPCLA